MAVSLKSRGRVAAASMGVFVVALGMTVMRSSGQTPPPAGGDPLQAEMRGMNTNFSALRSSVSDATKNEASIASAMELEKHIVTAKGLTPPTAATQPDDAKPKFLNAFKTELNKLERTVLDLEDQLMSGDNDAAVKTVASLQGIESEGHMTFRGGRGRGRRGGGGGAAAPAPAPAPMPAPQ